MPLAFSVQRTIKFGICLAILFDFRHHRQNIFSALLEDAQDKTSLITPELDNIYDTALSNDQKNYHAWQHRLWVVKSFPDSICLHSEVLMCHRILKMDPFNNSVFSYLHAILITFEADSSLWLAEVEFAKNLMAEFPFHDNDAAINFARFCSLHL